jgi:tetratricopeptide (TPR) repeat protein
MPEDFDSLQDIILKRQSVDFVGREGQLDRFAANLEVPPRDPRRRFVFSVHGDGGVGKTFLLGRLRRLADEHGAASAYVDDRIFSAVEAMGEISRQLMAAGAAMKEFSRLEEKYRRRRSEVESDPRAPSGIASIMARTTARIGQEALRSVPVVGGLAAAVDGETLAEQADALRRFLAGKLHHEDAKLLLSPIEALTPAFVRDLAAVGRDRSVALFIDTFEQTAPFLNDWLLAVLEGRYGRLPARIVLTIAGRRPVDRGSWSPYLGILADIPLAPFDEAHVRELLALKGVEDPRVADVIIRLSGGLPLLVAMLAEHQPDDASCVGDPSGDAVERFLKWESDPARRALALAAAVPRVVNEDMLRLLIDDIDRDAQQEFAWLRSLSFVTHRSGRCEYHAVVRSAMLRLERGQSPERWRARHEKLREHYAAQRIQLAAMGVDAVKGWREKFLDETYHRLCAEPQATLAEVLTILVHTVHGSDEDYATSVQMLVQAGEDSGSEAVSAWGARLSEALRSGPGGPVAVLDLLIRDGGLSPVTLSSAYDERARLNQQRARHPQALADVTRAIEYQPEQPWLFGRRAVIHWQLGEFDAAIADLDRQLELQPEAAYSYGFRAQIHRRTQRYEQALPDYDRALRDEPDNGLYLGERGMTYLALDRRTEAAADLARAADLVPAPALAAVYRATALLLAGRFEEAQAEATDLLAIAPGSAEAFVLRGTANLYLGRFQETVSDITQVVGRPPENPGALAVRGQALVALGRYEEALADLTRSLELQPGEHGTRYAASVAWRQLGDEPQAARHLAEAISQAERRGNLAQDGGLIIYRMTNGDAAEAGELFDRFLASPPSPVARRALERQLEVFAERRPGADRAAAQGMLARLRSRNPCRHGR